MFSQFNHYALEDFPGFPGMPGVFNRQYRCHSVAFIHRDNLESGGKIILPPSALDQLARLRIEYPMLFQLLHTSDEVTRKTHSGVLEFVAEEGNCYLPYWMMQHLLLEEGDLVTVRSATLPKGTFVRLRPHDTSFLDISNPRAVLENALRNFSCLTKDDVICIKYNNNNYYLDVLETKPGNAISIVEADVEVDFAAPLNYKEPTASSSTFATASPVGTPTSSASMPIPMRAGSGGSAAGSFGASNGMNIPGTSAGSTPKSLEGTSPTFAAFTGSGFRLDGKRQQLQAGGTSPAAFGGGGGGGMVFGRSPSGNAAFGTSPMATPPPPLSGTTPPATSGMVFGKSPSNGGIQRTSAPPPAGAAPAAAAPPAAAANANGAAGDPKKDPNFQAFSGKGYSLRG